MCINKHAYLIIAHANPFVLERLILLLDDIRNDIYIHVDKKTKNFDFSFFQSLPQKSKLVFIDRIDVRWGHVSQIRVELNLFKAANAGGIYSYFHLISGGDMPIKSQDYIHSFFEQNKGKEFVGFSNDTLDKDRVNKIHLFPSHMRVTEEQMLKRVARKLRMLFLDFQHAVGYSYGTNVKDEFVHGANWVSITSDLVRSLLKKEKWFLDFYRHSNCGDEIYKHTYIYNSAYKNAVYAPDDELKSCMRYMDWQRGAPYTFRSEDYNSIMNSDMLFARKFEDVVDTEIVVHIFSSLRNQ